MAEPVLHHHRLERRAEEEGLADDVIDPGDNLAVLHRTAQAMNEQRTIIAACEIILAGPHHLDWTVGANCFRHHGEFSGKMLAHLRTPTETTTGQHGLEPDLLWRQSEDTGNCLMLGRLELTAEAGQRLVAVPL